MLPSNARPEVKAESRKSARTDIACAQGQNATARTVGPNELAGAGALAADNAQAREIAVSGRHVTTMTEAREREGVRSPQHLNSVVATVRHYKVLPLPVKRNGTDASELAGQRSTTSV